MTECSETYNDVTRFNFEVNLREFLLSSREYLGTSDGQHHDLFQEDKEALTAAKAPEGPEIKDEDQEIL
jgi:hypothetical protein